MTSGRYAGRFDGLPTPAAAGMVASTVWFTEGFLRQDIGLPLGLPPMIPALGLVALGLLMVSPIPYRSFKDIRVPRSNGSIVVAVLAVLLLAMKPTLTFFVVGIIYVGHGPVAGYWRYRTGRELPSADPATASDAPQEAGS